MPKRPSKNTKAVLLELPPELWEDVKTFAASRDETARHVVIAALRRHMAYPPAPPLPPPEPVPEPLPDAPTTKEKKTRGTREGNPG